MRYRKFKSSDKSCYIFYAMRNRDRKLETLVSTIKGEKAMLADAKARLEGLRHGNLRMSAKMIPAALSEIAYHQEALHWMRKVLTRMWFEAHPERWEEYASRGGPAGPGTGTHAQAGGAVRDAQLRDDGQVAESGPEYIKVEKIKSNTGESA